MRCRNYGGKMIAEYATESLERTCFLLINNCSSLGRKERGFDFEWYDCKGGWKISIQLLKPKFYYISITRLSNFETKKKKKTNNWTFLNNKFPLSRILLTLNFPANKYVIILYINCTCTLYYRYYWYSSNTKDCTMNNIYLLIIRYD